MRKIKTFTLSVLLFAAITVQGQEGQYDVRFTEVESHGGIALIDVEIKAHAMDKEFYLAEQNLRFSFTGAMPYSEDNPSVEIQQELVLSGQVGNSFYAPHHLNGSGDKTISYNVELVGGEGYYITADEWIQIGRLAFHLNAIDADLNLTWHRIADFPPTYIAQKIGNQLVRANEGDYGDITSVTVGTEDVHGQDGGLKVFPNPTTANSTVSVILNADATYGNGNIVLIDALGRNIAQTPMYVQNGAQNYEFNLTDIPIGKYWINVQTARWISQLHPIIVLK